MKHSYFWAHPFSWQGNTYTFGIVNIHNSLAQGSRLTDTIKTKLTETVCLISWLAWVKISDLFLLLLSSRDILISHHKANKSNWDTLKTCLTWCWTGYIQSCVQKRGRKLGIQYNAKNIPDELLLVLNDSDSVKLVNFVKACLLY